MHILITQPIYFPNVPSLNRGRRSSSAVRCAAHSAGSEAAAERVARGSINTASLHRGPPAQWAARRRQWWRRQHQRSEGSFLVLLKSVPKFGNQEMCIGKSWYIQRLL